MKFFQGDFMSRRETQERFGACWEGLVDPRGGNATLPDFHELLMIALCAVLCGCQAVDIALFAKTKELFLRSFLSLANGVTNHDTFSRLFRNLDPDQFSEFISAVCGPVVGAVAG